MMPEIIQAQSGDDLEQVRILFREFADSIKRCSAEYSDLPQFKEYFQDREKELAGLPGGCGLWGRKGL